MLRNTISSFGDYLLHPPLVVWARTLSAIFYVLMHGYADNYLPNALNIIDRRSPICTARGDKFSLASSMQP